MAMAGTCFPSTSVGLLARIEVTNIGEDRFRVFPLLQQSPKKWNAGMCRAQGSEADGKKRVLVVGGTGRVGVSTLRALAREGDPSFPPSNQNQFKQRIHLTEIEILAHNRKYLQDQQKVRSLVRWSDMAVQAVDGFAFPCGSTVLVSQAYRQDLLLMQLYFTSILIDVCA